MAEAALSTYDVDSTTAFEVARLAKGNVVTDATTARILALTDASQLINMTSGSANTVTVPPNASVAFLIGAEVHIRQAGVGITTIVAGVGVTLEQPVSLTLVISEQRGVVTVKKLATNTWMVIGSLA